MGNLLLSFKNNSDHRKQLTYTVENKVVVENDKCHKYIYSCSKLLFTSINSSSSEILYFLYTFILFTATLINYQWHLNIKFKMGLSFSYEICQFQHLIFCSLCYSSKYWISVFCKSSHLISVCIFLESGLYFCMYLIRQVKCENISSHHFGLLPMADFSCNSASSSSLSCPSLLHPVVTILIRVFVNDDCIHSC